MISLLQSKSIRAVEKEKCIMSRVKVKALAKERKGGRFQEFCCEEQSSAAAYGDVFAGG